MTDREADLAQVEHAAREIIPQLTERLARHHLGELEVRHGSLRVRVSSATSVGAPQAAPVGEQVDEAGGQSSRRPPAAVRPNAPSPSSHGVTAPAVGYFGFAEGLGPGQQVDKGDTLGHVDMLGVRHEVRAPRRGTVRHLVAEAGEPVEYGQVLIEMEPAE